VLTNQRHLFEIPEDVTYLNCGYMSPLMSAAVEASQAGVARKARPWEISAGDFFSEVERLRGLAARLFQCTADDVALVPSASYGISTAARNLPIRRGQRILLLDEQFPANVYPWRRVAEEAGAEIVTVHWPDDGDWTPAVMHELEGGAAIAALPHTQWTSGGLLDLVTIGESCRRQGTALVLDLTQSLGAYPFDAARVRPDFAVAAGYKWLLSPYSTGVLYVAAQWQWQSGKPLEEGWIQRDNAPNFADLIHYTDGYQAGARRFDMSEHSNFALVPGAIRALEQILAWGVDEIAATTGALTSRLAQCAQSMGLTAVAGAQRAPHYLCLRGKGAPPAGLVEALSREKVYVSLRGASIRVTPHVYNSADDIDRLSGILKKTV
jgi:selenocysteine lyase/cysteine desulfurase